MKKSYSILIIMLLSLAKSFGGETSRYFFDNCNIKQGVHTETFKLDDSCGNADVKIGIEKLQNNSSNFYICTSSIAIPKTDNNGKIIPDKYVKILSGSSFVAQGIKINRITTGKNVTLLYEDDALKNIEKLNKKEGAALITFGDNKRAIVVKTLGNDSSFKLPGGLMPSYCDFQIYPTIYGGFKIPGGKDKTIKKDIFFKVDDIKIKNTAEAPSPEGSV